ncbi:hypothetical protein IMX07_07590 [bacterium]|nr:hypothetical protein [bacterium]
MKRFLTIVGAIALAFFIGILALISIVAVKGRALDAESKRYADQVIINIVSDWNKQALLAQASPDFARACPAACTDALFEQTDKLGAMTHYLGSKGQANINFFISNGIRITATYIARATFAHGAAAMKLDIVKKDGKWRILGFFVHLQAIPSPGTA